LTKLLVTRKSKIHGTGVFAGADLPRDLWIPIPFTWVDETIRDAFEGGLSPRQPFCFLNHADKPNCEVVNETVGRMHWLFLLVLRRIKAGHELTIDYGDEYWETL
jgi:SET domain-containing protein